MYNKEILKAESPEDAKKLEIWQLYRMGMYYLSTGDFRKGWILFEKRLNLYPDTLQKRLTTTPADLSEFKDKKICIVGDPDWKPIINGQAQPDYRIMMGGF